MVFCTVVFMSFRQFLTLDFLSELLAHGGVHFRRPIYHSTQIPLCSSNDQPTAF